MTHAERFRDFFQALHGKSPFPWQQRLAERVCAEGWATTRVIDLPTGSGKTACLDIAVYALAFGDVPVPRRTLYIVDRRLVVNEAFLRMRRIQAALAEPDTEILRHAAKCLLDKAHADATDPLLAFELRGGTYQDNSWVRTPLQPLLVAGTVDQLGSRLLFRAYGVPDTIAPIHAALVAHDSLILLDEAHASRAFSQTLEAVEAYAKLPTTGNGLPPALQFVEMTATPNRAVPPGARFNLDDHDRKNDILRSRLRAPKPVTLINGKAKRDDFNRLADELIAATRDLGLQAPAAKRIAILCNRVATARTVFNRLLKAGDNAHLVTGRMRPLDRDDLYTQALAPLRSDRPRQPGDQPVYVVSTQSLEVGADLDFDLMVTELASLDALLQRFGRLNRSGDATSPAGAILAAPMHLEARKPDPVYGNVLPGVWQWLSDRATAGAVSFALEAADHTNIPTAAAAEDPDKRASLIRLGPNAPILLPAHLDALCQTSPRPSPEPDLALFLHGQPTTPEVQLVLRADLTASQKDAWCDLVKFCPPLAAEALSVRIGTLRRWITDARPTDADDADIEGVPGEPDDEDFSIPGVLWRDGKATNLDRETALRPGDTIVLPASRFSSHGLPDSFGHIPAGAALDLGDRAHWAMKRRLTLRLHPDVIAGWPGISRKGDFAEAAKSLDAACIAQLLAQPCPSHAWLDQLLAQFHGEPAEVYPDSKGFMLESRVRRASDRSHASHLTLKQHLADVEAASRRLTRQTLPESLATAVADAARRHDWGKADPRFQAMLRGGDGLAGRFAPTPIAKSAVYSPGAWTRCGLPDGFRHESLSFLLANAQLAPGHPERDLVLHLIATHHGRCRPFAPVVDDSPRDITLNGIGGGLRLTAAEIQAAPAHHLASGIPARFWSLTRRFGWWGLAFFESMLRLADWEASALAAAGADND